MKIRYRIGSLTLTVFWIMPVLVNAQLCEPIYQVEKVQVINNPTGQMEGKLHNMLVSVGQPATLNLSSNFSKNSIATGFWSHYLMEPAAPIVRASDGDFQDIIVVEWDIEGDRTGPPVTSQEAILYRNKYVLTTLPIQQTQFQDLNVFPGMTYNYGVVVSNQLGKSHPDNDIGFLNPNGMITGHVETPSGNPVVKTKVLLKPNLGRCAKFDGDGYIYWFDGDINTNRQFHGLESSYTIETWFRSIILKEQMLFAAVDSASTDHFLTLSLTTAGKVRWTHQPTAGQSGTEIMTVKSYAGTGADWHHLAAVYADSNRSMTLYIDGFLAGEATASGPLNDRMEIILGKRSPRQPEMYLNGRLDDFRIWSYARKWDDLRDMLDITLSGEEDRLAAYWKFDEMESEIVFDLTARDNDGATCRVERDSYIAPVYLGALTDRIGNYAIKGIYYAGGTVFTVTPSMASPIGRSLELDGIDDYIRFDGQRVQLKAGYTLEGWFKTASTGTHTLFAAVDPADDRHRLKIELADGRVVVAHFSAQITSGSNWNDNLWHHYAVTNDNSTLRLYLDGKLAGSATVTQPIPDLSEIVIGRSSVERSQNYFKGRLDEMRLWNAARTAEQVGGTMNQVLEGDEFGLIHYWRMNDGTSNLLTDATGLVTGMIIGADSLALKKMWNQDIPLNEYFEHWYEPESRNAALNSSNTAVNNVDFKDKALIPVSGYVRYKDTACFQEGVEILLNGASLIPPIYTNADGKFILDLEPGSTGQIITCKYQDHEFSPSMIELPVIVQPLAGLFFDDQTAYKVTGYVAGGTCKYPITPGQGQITVTFSAVNGCIEKSVVPDPGTGMYESPKLPPLIYNLTVNHPDPKINDFFVGDTLSLEKSDRARDFIYRAAPEVEFTDLPTNESGCNSVVLKQLTDYQAKVRVFERYGTNKCPLDTFQVEIFDNLTDTSYLATIPNGQVAANTEYSVYFTPREPNILGGGAHPYQKSFQIVVTDAQKRQASAIFWAYVTGDKKWEGNNFTTSTSQMPWFVLRNPPGDASYTYLTKDQEINRTTSLQKVDTEGNATNETLHLGWDKTVMTGFGVAIETQWEVTLDAGHGWEGTVTNTSVDELTTTFSRSETYSTSGDGVTGDDASVFVGGGLTMTYGVATRLSLDSQCKVQLDTTLVADFKGFSSTYMYSKYHIKNTLIPNLQFQYNQTHRDSTLMTLNFWKDILKKDSIAVATAKPSTAFSFGKNNNTHNLSFDAGVSLEYSISTGKTHSCGTMVNNEDTHEAFGEFGFTIDAFGFSGMYAHTWYNAKENSTINDTTNSQTVGFVLDDDDPGDAFTVNVFEDPTWGMPVFKVLGGQSSCPHETATVRRHVAALSISEKLQVDVPPDEPAVFTLMLGNNSETGESDTYILSALNESNPDGAKLFTTENLANGVSYTLEAGEMLPVTLQVFRGPEKYEYDNLTLELAPACGGQDETSATISFSVRFQEPCSESHIASPKSGWLIDSSQDSDTLWVTVDGYNWPADNFLTSIDLQYRPASGGSWFTACSVPRDSLKDSYVMLPFNISPAIISDGGYELRSQAMCNGGKYPGTSPTVTGLIDRCAPKVLGLPEPVDGILGPDDLIRVTFNEEVACGEIKPGAGDIMLFNTVTGKAMDYTYTCGGNTITFEPNVQNYFIENQIFRAEIHNLQDIYGNRRAADNPVVWEFYVNRNPIEWSGTSLERVVLNVDEEFSTVRELVNHGGSNRSWQIIGGREGALPSGQPLKLPDWLKVTPSSGTLTPGEAQELTISLAEELGFGEYKTTIYAAGTQGDEPLPVSIRKLCYPPEWKTEPARYQYTMTITATLSVESILSADVYDQVGVFVEDEVRGVANVQYLPALNELANTHPYRVFLTIYSNQLRGEPLEFRVWDASDCRELGMILEEYTFEANANHGTPTSPVTISATNQIIAQIPFLAGWKWFSLNLKKPDMSVNHLLKSLEPQEGNLLKSQTRFDQYVPNFGWVGTLDTLDTRSMYLMHLSQIDTLELVGYPVDVETDTIQINRGWNWIGYSPQQSIAVNSALGSLKSAATGDLIKSQFKYAQFVEGLGWMGSLEYMHPNEGYLLSVLNSGELVYPYYPEPSGNLAKAPVDALPVSTRWTVNASRFQQNMTITAYVAQQSSVADSGADLLAAFVDAAGQLECRGVARATYLPEFQQRVFFLLVSGNGEEATKIQFRFYDSRQDEVLYIPTELEFISNEILGHPNAPHRFFARPLVAGDPGFIPEIYSLSDNFPNPFNPVTKIGYGIPRKSLVEIVVYDMLGRRVQTLVSEIRNPGYYFVTWDGADERGIPVASSVYFFRIQAGTPANDPKLGIVQVKKMVLIK